jgi:HAD superfamily hydrolase (TIGR01509 family)
MTKYYQNQFTLPGKISVVLFDLDGVLVDACDWHFVALNKALRDTVDIEISRHDHEKKYNGLPTKVKLEMLGIDNETSNKIWKTKQDLTLGIIKKNSCPAYDKIYLHDVLKENSIKIGCVTNSIRETSEAMLKSTSQYDFIDLLITNEDVKNNKPSPDCYDLAVEKFGVDPKNVLIVEDSDKGFEAATTSVVPNIWKVDNCKEVNYKNFKEFLDENFNTNGG